MPVRQPPDVGLSPRLPEVLDIVLRAQEVINPFHQQYIFTGDDRTDPGQIQWSQIHLPAMNDIVFRELAWPGGGKTEIARSVEFNPRRVAFVGDELRPI
jgi:hypothetical protein